MQVYHAYGIDHLLRISAEDLCQKVYGLQLILRFLCGDKEMSRIETQPPVVELSAPSAATT